MRRVSRVVGPPTTQLPRQNSRGTGPAPPSILQRRRSSLSLLSLSAPPSLFSGAEITPSSENGSLSGTAGSRVAPAELQDPASPLSPMTPRPPPRRSSSLAASGLSPSSENGYAAQTAGSRLSPAGLEDSASAPGVLLPSAPPKKSHSASPSESLIPMKDSLATCAGGISAAEQNVKRAADLDTDASTSTNAYTVRQVRSGQIELVCLSEV